jgi:hypothetical protein
MDPHQIVMDATTLVGHQHVYSQGAFATHDWHLHRADPHSHSRIGKANR